MKTWANNNWKAKTVNTKKWGKKFQVEYFHSFTSVPQYKTVLADDSQMAIAKFQEAVKWDYDKIGIITEVLS